MIKTHVFIFETIKGDVILLNTLRFKYGYLIKCRHKGVIGLS